MKETAKKYLRGSAALVLFGGMVFMIPATLQAKTTLADISVHVEVNVHGSDIGVSSDVLEETVDKLLEEAEIEVSESGGSNVTVLKIDIYKDPNADSRRLPTGTMTTTRKSKNTAQSRMK